MAPCCWATADTVDTVRADLLDLASLSLPSLRGLWLPAGLCRWLAELHRFRRRCGGRRRVRPVHLTCHRRRPDTAGRGRGHPADRVRDRRPVRVLFGRRLRAAVDDSPSSTVLDSVGGSLVSVLSMLLIAWAIGSVLTASSFQGVVTQVDNSAVLGTMDKVMPSQAKTMFSEFRRLLASGPFRRCSAASAPPTCRHQPAGPGGAEQPRLPGRPQPGYSRCRAPR